MLHIIQGFERNLPQNAPLIAKMHEFRAKAFGERRGWRVNVSDGKEVDDFDQMDPLYVILSDGMGEHVASVRLLPTTGPYMMSEIFSDVAGPGGIVRHPLIWECSRFCVDTEWARDFGQDGVNIATRMLLFGVFRTALEIGLINLVGVYDVYMERILKRTGCIMERMGPVVRYDDDLRTVSGLFEVSPQILERLAARPGPGAHHLHHLLAQTKRGTGMPQQAFRPPVVKPDHRLMQR